MTSKRRNGFGAEADHRLYSGVTGSGKGHTACTDILGWIKSRVGWTKIVLPHEEWGLERIIPELRAWMGDNIKHLLRVEVLRDMTKVLPRRMLHVSSADDPWTRKKEDQEHRGMVYRMAAHNRGVEHFGETPGIDRNFPLTCAMYQDLDCWKSGGFVSEKVLPDVLVPASYAWAFFLKHVQQEAYKRELMRWLHYPENQRLAMLDPSIRVHEKLYRAPVLESRLSLPGAWNDVAFLNRAGSVHIILAGNVDEEDLRAYFTMDYHRTVWLVKNGLIGPGRYMIDEPTNYGLISPHIANGFATLRAFGMGVWMLIQDADFPTPESGRKIMQNSNKRILRQEDPDMRQLFARILRGNLDPDKIHHYDEARRQVHDGFDEIDRETISTTSRPEGATSTTKGKATSSRPRYREEVEKRPVYQPGPEQEFWLELELSQLERGDVWVKNLGQQPYKDRAEPWRNSFHSDEKAYAHALKTIDILKQLPDYQTPVEYELPIEEEVIQLLRQLTGQKQPRPQPKPQRNGNGHAKGAGGRLSGRSQNGGNGKPPTSHK